MVTTTILGFFVQMTRCIPRWRCLQNDHLYWPDVAGKWPGLTPATLSFQDKNGDGRVDLVVHILDQTFVYLNNGSKFVPPSNSIVERGSNPPHLGAKP